MESMSLGGSKWSWKSLLQLQEVWERKKKESCTHERVEVIAPFEGCFITVYQRLPQIMIPFLLVVVKSRVLLRRNALDFFLWLKNLPCRTLTLRNCKKTLVVIRSCCSWYVCTASRHFTLSQKSQLYKYNISLFVDVYLTPLFSRALEKIARPKKAREPLSSFFLCKLQLWSYLLTSLSQSYNWGARDSFSDITQYVYVSSL